MRPFRLAPRFLDKVWAGGRLEAWLPAAGPRCGEAWLATDVDRPLAQPEAGPQISEIVDGEHAGLNLRELLCREPRALVGWEVPAEERAALRFPLLVKLLDVGQRLSVQVHPSGELAQELGSGPVGKSEAWLVLEPGPRARCWLDLDSLERDQAAAKIEAGTLDGEDLRSFVPLPGEGVEIRPGRVHAAEDLVILEIQEPSDVTYRVHDWGRLPARTLHREQAAACLRRLNPELPERGPQPGWRPGERELAPASPFRFRALELTAGERWSPPPGLGVLVPLEGALRWEGQELPRGQAWVLPAERPQVVVEAREPSRCGLASYSPAARPS